MADKVETMAYRKEGGVPWHGMGNPVRNGMTPEEMGEAGGVLWPVEVKPTFFENSKGILIPTGDGALIRTSDDTVLSRTSGTWNPIQNIEALEFFNDYVLAGDMEMETCGSLDGGKYVFVLARIKESFKVPYSRGRDEVVSHLLFTNPHVYGRSADVRLTPIRVVCWNTLSMALNGKSDKVVKITHRKAFDAEQVKETLALAHTKLEAYKEAAGFLAKKTYTDDKVQEYFGHLFKVNNKVPEEDKKRHGRKPIAERAMEVLETQPGAKMNAGTWWQAFNAVTYLADHELGNSEEGRLTSSWYGPNRDRKIKALNLAVEMAEAS